MEFGYLTPPPNIAVAVKAVWMARGTRAEFERSDPIVPDGCVEMVFNFADPFREGAARQPADLLVGQMMRPTVATPTGAVDLIGFRLSPGRAGAMLRTPMWELRDRMVRVSDLINGAGGWIDDFRELPPEARLAQLASRLADRCARVDLGRVRIVESALSRINEQRGSISIEQLAREAGVSRRHLERQFNEQVGLGAKQVARIARVQAALRIVKTEPDLAGVEIALQCGFADQAHLIKECRAIAGVTPARFLSTANSLSTLMRS